MNFQDYIAPELFVLIPVLYAVGAALKHSQRVKDTYIPIAVGLCGVVLAGLYGVATTLVNGYPDVAMAVFTAIVQGVLCAAAAVYANQIGKQSKKDA